MSLDSKSEKKSLPPQFESFALRSKPAFPRAPPKTPSPDDADDVHVTVISPKDLPRNHPKPPAKHPQKNQVSLSIKNFQKAQHAAAGVAVKDVKNSHTQGTTVKQSPAKKVAEKPAYNQTKASPVVQSSKRATKPPARDTSYVYDDEDDEDEELHAAVRKSEQSQPVAESKAVSGRRRQQRVIDDSSDEEYDPAAEKKSGPVAKKARRTMIDHDDPVEEEDYHGNGIIVVDDDDKYTGNPKDVMSYTLNKCDRIATLLRSELGDGTEVSAPKVVTEAQVQAACQMAGSKDQMLSPYQLVGVNFLLLLFRKRVGGAILADEMGLGKTVQAIVFLALIKHLDGDSGPHLIVTPASVLENWQRELQKWCPAFTVIPFHGTERNNLKDELLYAARSGDPPPFHVFLTCYSLFERKSAASKDDRSMLRKWKWSCVVMDEAHLLKDRSSYRAKHLRSVAQRAKHRLMITGTPLQNDLQELWSLLEFTMPNIFKNCDFDDMLEMRNGRKVVTADNMDLINQLKTILVPFVLRRVKADVMHQLIPKTHKIELLEMVEIQKDSYNQALEEYRELAKRSATPGAETFPKRQISSIFTHLRKLANHPLLVRRVYSNSDIDKLSVKCHKNSIFGDQCSLDRVREELSNFNDYTLHKLCSSHSVLAGQLKLTGADVWHSAKAQVLFQLLPKLRDTGHRPLIFSQWTGMLDILEWVLQVLNMNYNRLDGGTQVSQRQTLVDEFNNDTSIFAFLLSTRAGGQGLNLTGADTVIIHDVDFNPQMDRQAEDRCHRIGQSKPVTIYRLVTKSTVDENIYEIAQRKLILDAVLEDDPSKAGDEEDSAQARTMGQILSNLLQPK